MSGWERNAKRFIKGLLWAPVYVFGALALGLQPSWQLLTLVIACHVWGDLIDAMIPTDATACEQHRSV